MAALSKAWITLYDAGLGTLTLRSENIEPEWRRLFSKERTFPATDPQNHIIMIGLLDDDDLLKIKTAIEEYLNK
jgi:hypothetical protein